MYDDTITQPMPEKLSDILADSWTFPIDYPIVSNTTSFDATRTLKAAIAYGVTEYYKDHRICSFVRDNFTRSLSARMYKVMSQHQYWVDQYLNLIEDNQFFYNDEEQNLLKNIDQTANGLSRESDTPQNVIGDIDQYLTSASKSDDTSSGTETNLNAIHKSTLGDITVQFRNFANFPNFMDTIIEAVRPCFINYYGDEDIDYGTTE